MTALLSTPTIPGTGPARAHDRFNTVACLAIGAAILSYCIAEPSLALAAFSLPILALAWWLARAGRPPVLPRLVINVLVLITIGRAFVLVIGSPNPVVSHLSEFLILIQLVKLFDRHTPRDEAQMLSLSLFIVIGALLTSNTLGVGALLLAYTPLATAAAMLLQIRAGLTRAQAADPTALPTRATAVFAADLSRPGPPPRARAARRHFLGVVGSAIALSFAMALVIFFLAPRGIGQDNFGRLGQMQRSSTIGFTDQVRLGDSGFLGGDTTPVMDILIRDERSQRTGSDLRSLHLRGAVLNAYDPQQRTWRPSGRRSRGSSEVDLYADQRYALAPGAGGRLVYRLDVNLRDGFAGRTGYLFSLWAPTAIEFPTRESIVRPGADYTLRRARGSGEGRLRYTIWTDLEGAGPDETRRRGPSLERRAAPFASGPIRDLAVRLLTERDIPIDPAAREPSQARSAANILLTHLRREYEYTLEMVAPGPGQDPIEMFLFGTKRGHCEYFASALVALCQSVGVDARLVTGYLATEFNPVTGQYLVRQSNAHAWAEVNFDGEAGGEGGEGGGGTGGGRWHTMDPSPPAAIDAIHRPRSGVLARLRQVYEAIDFAWTDTVVSFDDRRRSDLIGRVFGGVDMDGFASAMRRITARIGSSVPRAGLTTEAGWVMLVGGGVVLLALLALAPRLLRRRRRRRTGLAAAHADPQLRRLLAGAVFYDRALRLLDRAGLGKPDSRPPLAHADALAATNPEPARLFRALAALYYRPRFARVPLSGPEAAEADRLLDQLAASLSPGASAPSMPTSR